jgi:hypothetical protein
MTGLYNSSYFRRAPLSRLQNILQTNHLSDNRETSSYEIIPSNYIDPFIESDNILFEAVTSSKICGNLLYRTYQKLLAKNILRLTDLNEKLTKTILGIYQMNIQLEEIKSLNTIKDTKNFISCLPSLNKLKKFIEKINLNTSKHRNNIYFIKICFDIYENFLKKYDFPFFKKYKGEFLDIAIQFYSKLSPNSLKSILKNMEKNLNPAGSNF